MAVLRLFTSRTRDFFHSSYPRFSYHSWNLSCFRQSRPPHLSTSSSASAWNSTRLARGMCSATSMSSGVLTESPVLKALRNTAANRGRKSILIDSHGQFTASQLLTQADNLASHLPPNQPVAVFLPPDNTFVTGLLAAWRVSAPAVPLSPLFPAAAIAPLIKTATPSTIITSQALRHALPTTSIPILSIDEIDNTGTVGKTGLMDSYEARQSPSTPTTPVAPSSIALIFFTSGTTGAPKGVVWTHDMLSYQLETLSAAWKWTQDDCILNALPLHHIHGLVNIVLSALYNGASLEMHSAFDPYSVWSAFTRSNRNERPTIFMAVPSIYQRLIKYHDEMANDRERRLMKDATSAMRLFVSGSAALSKMDFDAWLNISGHAILERYGMTETGMTLSNDYNNRKRGMLGGPLPGVDVRLDESGQLLVKGQGVFPGYWNDLTRTNDAFTRDGYFRTGDVVEQDEESGYYRLLGRANADFVKSGGFRISTLEVEEVIREADGVKECAVLGIPDQLLGERIVVAMIPTDEIVMAGIQSADQNEFVSRVRQHALDRLPKYKVPRDFMVVADLPRNVLGKVQKQILRSRLLS